MSEEKKDLVWGVIHSGPLMFLGAFCDYPVEESISGRENAVNDVIQKVERDVENGRLIRLEPVMELAAPLQQVRQPGPGGQDRVGVAKSPLPMPYGFTTGKAKLRVMPNAFAFIDEMSVGDKQLYNAFIESVVKAETEERANRAGITLASSLNGAGRG
jgi:hypothetical protein